MLFFIILSYFLILFSTKSLYFFTFSLSLVFFLYITFWHILFHLKFIVPKLFLLRGWTLDTVYKAKHSSYPHYYTMYHRLPTVAQEYCILVSSFLLFYNNNTALSMSTSARWVSHLLSTAQDIGCSGQLITSWFSQTQTKLTGTDGTWRQ